MDRNDNYTYSAISDHQKQLNFMFPTKHVLPQKLKKLAIG